jgi:Zn-dependent metalloprotease
LGLRKHIRFSTKHGRNSYDNAGAKIKSYITTIAVDIQTIIMRWNGSVMTYGDGSGTGG